MNILAIDPGKGMTGWAAYDELGLVSGTMSFAKIKDDGELYRTLYTTLENWCDRFEPRLIAIETPCPRNQKSGKVQYGMLATIELYAVRNGIGYLEYHNSEVKKYARGLTEGYSGIAIPDDVSVAKLSTCMLFTQVHGKLPKTHDEADAFSLLCLAGQEQGIDVTGVDTVQRAA